MAPELAARITDARVIVDFRNVLTHEYAAVDDDAVYGVATEDLATLREECADLLPRVEARGSLPGRAGWADISVTPRSARRC